MSLTRGGHHSVPATTRGTIKIADGFIIGLRFMTNAKLPDALAYQAYVDRSIY